MEECMLDDLLYLEKYCSKNIPISEDRHVFKEGIRVCPLCRRRLKFLFYSLEGQVLMCRNLKCQYPFGLKEVEYNEIEDATLSDISSLGTKPSQSSSGSTISTNAWSEIDKITKLLESEESQLDQPVLDNNKQKERSAKKLDSDSINKIQMNIEQIRGLNMELMELSENKSTIKNEKWVKKLWNLQGASGSALLTPQEIKQLQTKKKSKPAIKIDIQPGDSTTVSTIRIDLAQ